MSRFYIEGFEGGGIQPPVWSYPGWSSTIYTQPPGIMVPPSGGTKSLGEKCLGVYWNQSINLDIEAVGGRGNFRSLYMKARLYLQDTATNVLLFNFTVRRNEAIMGTLSTTATGWKYVAGSATYQGGTIVTANEWFILEMWIKLSTDYITADGEIEIHKDGVQQFSDYAARTNNTSNASSSVAAHSVSKIALRGGYQYKRAYWDDMVFDSTSSFGTALNASVIGYVPSSDVTTNWTVPAGANYPKIANTTGEHMSRNIDGEYITTNVVTTKDLYGTAKDFTDGTGSMDVQAVQVQTRARRQGPCPASQVRPYLKTGGVEYPGTSEIAPYENFQTRYSVWIQNPNTLTDWTEADLNNLEVGVESVS